MTKEDEDKIIAQAQDILARRMAVEKDIKVDLRNLAFYSSYYNGAIAAVRRFFAALFMTTGRKPKGDDWIYMEAEWKLVTSNLRSMQLFLDGCDVRYRNWKHNKKGKLESCEAYFVERRMVTQEVK